MAGGELRWRWAAFEQLTNEELYAAMRLRQEVFVVEQECPYLDADGRDREALHLLGEDSSGLAAYARVLMPGVLYPEHCISRVVTAQRVRRSGLGRLLMEECLRGMDLRFGPVPIRISAQAYLVRFYQSLGFERTGKAYLEDGIPHEEMLKN